MPNELSITPTANFSVFSGTFASGARAATPDERRRGHASPARRGGQRDAVLVGAEGEHDERDLETLEEHPLEGDREGVAVEPDAWRRPRAPRWPAL